MTIMSSIVDGSIAILGLIASLTTSIWAVKATESAVEAAGEPHLSENRLILKKAA